MKTAKYYEIPVDVANHIATQQNNIERLEAQVEQLLSLIRSYDSPVAGHKMQMALEFMNKNRGATRHEFKEQTELAVGYYDKAKQILDINLRGRLTKVSQVADYIERNPDAKGGKIIKIFNCSRSTYERAREVVTYRGSHGIQIKGLCKTEPKTGNYNEMITKAWV